MSFAWGISINDWALPIHLFIGRPYTNTRGEWVTQVANETNLCPARA